MLQPAFVVHIADHFADGLDGVSAMTVPGNALQPLTKAAQFFCFGFAQILLETHFVNGSHHADAAFIGVGAQTLKNGGTNFAPGSINDAQKGIVIIRIDEQAQVGH